MVLVTLLISVAAASRSANCLAAFSASSTALALIFRPCSVLWAISLAAADNSVVVSTTSPRWFFDACALTEISFILTDSCSPAAATVFRLSPISRVRFNSSSVSQLSDSTCCLLCWVMTFISPLSSSIKTCVLPIASPSFCRMVSANCAGSEPCTWAGAVKSPSDNKRSPCKLAACSAPSSATSPTKS